MKEDRVLIDIDLSTVPKEVIELLIEDALEPSRIPQSNLFYGV